MTRSLQSGMSWSLVAMTTSSIESQAGRRSRLTRVPPARLWRLRSASSCPSIRRELRGKVTDMNTDNLAEGGSLANAVSVTLSALPGNWAIV